MRRTKLIMFKFLRRLRLKRFRRRLQKRGRWTWPCHNWRNSLTLRSVTTRTRYVNSWPIGKCSAMCVFAFTAMPWFTQWLKRHATKDYDTNTAPLNCRPTCEPSPNDAIALLFFCGARRVWRGWLAAKRVWVPFELAIYAACRAAYLARFARRGEVRRRDTAVSCR